MTRPGHHRSMAAPTGWRYTPRSMARRTDPPGDGPGLAFRIGTRIRAARLAAGLTHQQLAEGRYTKAYISALEQGHASHRWRRSTSSPSGWGCPHPASWSRRSVGPAGGGPHAGIGRVARRIDRLPLAPRSARDRGVRAELSTGLAEALCRLEQGHEALAFAAEAVDLFRALGRHEDALTASYWLAYARFQCADVWAPTHCSVRSSMTRRSTRPGTCASGSSWRSGRSPRTRAIMPQRPTGSIAHVSCRTTSTTADARHCCPWSPPAEPPPGTWRARSGQGPRASLCIGVRKPVTRRRSSRTTSRWRSSRRPGAGRGYAAGARRRYEIEGDRSSLRMSRTPRHASRSPPMPRRTRCAWRGRRRPCHRVGQRAALSNALVTSARCLGALGRSDEAFDRLRTGGRPAAGRGRTARPAGSPHGPRRPARWPGAAPRGLRPDPRGARDPWPDGRATHGGRCRRRPSACVTSPASVKQWCIVPCDRRPPGGPVPDTGSCRGGRRRATGSAASAALPARATSRVPSPRRLRCVDG